MDCLLKYIFQTLYPENSMLRLRMSYWNLHFQEEHKLFWCWWNGPHYEKASPGQVMGHLVRNNIWTLCYILFLATQKHALIVFHTCHLWTTLDNHRAFNVWPQTVVKWSPSFCVMSNWLTESINLIKYLIHPDVDTLIDVRWLKCSAFSF